MMRALPFLLTVVALSVALPAYAVEELGWPQFHLTNGDVHCAGKAFAVRWYRGRSLLLMPLHLLSPEAAYKRYISPQEVGREVASLEILDLRSFQPIATAGKCLLKTGATVGQNSGDLSDDLMAFEAPTSSRLTPFNIFYGQVPVGTKVTVLASLKGSSDQPTRYTGVVASSKPVGISINMDRPLTALSCSGAPIVNAKNELVGMMVGKRDDTRTVVMAIPSSSLIRRLYAEIGQ